MYLLMYYHISVLQLFQDVPGSVFRPAAIIRAGSLYFITLNQKSKHIYTEEWYGKICM